jgi:hypothetical protein
VNKVLDKRVTLELLPVVEHVSPETVRTEVEESECRVLVMDVAGLHHLSCTVSQRQRGGGVFASRCVGKQNQSRRECVAFLCSDVALMWHGSLLRATDLNLQRNRQDFAP